MYFSGMKTLDDLFIKCAKLEVLLHSIESSREGTTIIPVRCPAKGRADDYGRTEDENPACVYKNNNCRYFVRARFSLDSFTKEIVCEFVKNNKEE